MASPISANKAGSPRGACCEAGGKNGMACTPLAKTSEDGRGLRTVRKPPLSAAIRSAIPPAIKLLGGANCVCAGSDEGTCVGALVI